MDSYENMQVTDPPVPWYERIQPFKTLYSWREIWFWPAVAFVNLKLCMWAVYLTTGHWPQESTDALVGLGINILVVACAISLTSQLRESTGKWYTKEQEMSNPHLIWSQQLGKVTTFIAILWGLKH